MKKLLCCLIAVIAPLQAGELIPSQIPATSKWWAHADLDAMRASATGKAVFTRIEADHGAQLRAFKRMFSVHLLNDLHGITLFGNGKPDQAVALIDGAFDRAHIEDVIQGADAYQAANHAGVTIHTWKDKGVTQHAAFFTDKLLVFSRQEKLLHESLDVLKAHAPAAADAFFAAAGGKPLLAANARLGEIDKPGDAARIVRMVNTLRIAAVEHDGRFAVRLAADTAKASDADRLRRILDGVIAFGEVDNVKFDGLDLRADLAVAPDKPTLTATLSLPTAEWLKLLDQAPAKPGK